VASTSSWLTEHHGSDDGYLPAPGVLAGGIAARTKQARIRIAAYVLPLHNPVNVAEQVIVLDQLSNGRAEVAAAAGYVPIEFAMYGRNMRHRARLLEEQLPVLDAALTGGEFEVGGETCRLTPGPVQRPRPPFWVAGGVPATARRAARHADGFFSLVDAPALFDLYAAECRKAGKPAGPMLTAVCPQHIQITEDDPEKTWSVLEPHALHELNSYGKWAAESTGGKVRSPYQPIEDPAAVRHCGLYHVMNVDQTVELMLQLESHNRSFMLNPIMAGLSPEVAMSSLKLLFDEVLPRFKAKGGTTGPMTFRPGVAPIGGAQAQAS
jgi:alkanesulfonate monooxygenase SsuD/methylene tetrahydromethanopterin reductase-like flavin-dependent oxidoreductase (luciferase family)